MEGQLNSLARAGAWGHVPRDGTGRQETQGLFSWPKAEREASEQWQSGKCLKASTTEPDGEERKEADVGCRRAHLSSLLSKQ